MSTKDLARTPLEAGHHDHYKCDRKRTNRRLRRLNHEYVRKALLDEDAFEGNMPVVEPVLDTSQGRGARQSTSHPILYKCLRSWDQGYTHDDRLGAVKRYARSLAGRDWEEVRREIQNRFTSRTMAGRHIRRHMKSELHNLFIDQHGRVQRLYRTNEECNPCDSATEIDWGWKPHHIIDRDAQGSLWFCRERRDGMYERTAKLTIAQGEYVESQDRREQSSMMGFEINGWRSYNMPVKGFTPTI